MTGETKLRTLAAEDATLQGFFGTNPFRWFHVQLPPGYVSKMPGTCATVQQISTQFLWSQEARADISRQRFQIIVRDPNVDVVDQAAAAIVDWLGTIDLASDDQFLSPPVTPRQTPNVVLDMRPGLDVQLKPPVPTVLIDFKSWVLDLI